MDSGVSEWLGLCDTSLPSWLGLNKSEAVVVLHDFLFELSVVQQWIFMPIHLFVATDVHRKYTGSEKTKWG